MSSDYLTKFSHLENEIDLLFNDLFPICRSITGDGVRQTLSRLQKITKFDIKEIPSGTKCYDWIVPEEWNVEDAFIENSSGEKIVDFKQNNLHLVNYSIPIDEIVDFSELEKHLFSLPGLPDAIPYRTTYYKKNWGFCISQDKLSKFDKSEKYHVVIKSSLKSGNLTYGEKIIPGTSNHEILISTYCCHPSIANDNLSGLVLWILLLRELSSKKNYHTYRFVVVPETIGAISYLSQNEAIMKKITAGFILTCVSGPSNFSYKQTFHGDHHLDKIVSNSFSDLNLNFMSYPFDINGSDERQYSSPFFRIPIGTICKDKYYEYDFYHTSKDDLSFINSKYLIESLGVYSKILENIENTKNFAKTEENKKISPDESVYLSQNPNCEPFLSKYGLYPSEGGAIKQRAFNLKNIHNEQNYDIQNNSISGLDLDIIRWLLFYCDGKNSLETISKKLDYPLQKLCQIAEQLTKLELLKSV